MVSRSNRSEQYRRIIAPFLEEWAERDLNDAQQFRNWSVQQVLWDSGLSMADVEDATSIDGPGDKGIDAWYYDDSDNPPRLTLVQAKNTRIEREDFSKLTVGFLDVILPNRPGGANQALREKAAAFRDAMPVQFRLDVYLTSSVIAQQGLQPREDGEPLYTEALHVGNSIAEASYYVRDIKFLIDNLQVIHRNPIAIAFQVERDSFFEFAVGGHTKTVCAALKATELAKLFDDQRENLFRKNPRYYLLQSARNKEIKESLRESQNEDFFVYNNGLTCIAQSIRTSTQDENDYTIEVSDFQIVNGCQTVASLWSTWMDRDTDLSKVRVLAKIVENPLAGAVNDHTSTRIAVRSNTQNPLKAEDWKANDDRQERWQGMFNRLPEPWYYEIKRGVWATEFRLAHEKSRFRVNQANPLPLQYRKVSMKDLGQACYAFIGYPAEAVDKAREIFNDPARYDQVFAIDLTPNQLLLPYLIYLEADKKRREMPVYILPDTEGFEVKTDHLRFPVVNAVGRMLSTLAGVPQGYFPAADSDVLVQTRTIWMPAFVENAFDVLARKLATESRERGRGPRSIVRGNEWMNEAVADAIWRVREHLRMAASFGQTGEGTILGALPFEVR